MGSDSTYDSETCYMIHQLACRSLFLCPLTFYSPRFLGTWSSTSIITSAAILTNASLQAQAGDNHGTKRLVMKNRGWPWG
jgi:hypothetical protein